ncbi:MAG: glycosyl hydrolase family 28-related protein [Kiritimatiellae bacterium]|nr:glycosyl hydrolase family 28-related protein [Kiritimatiellia bacterium]
MSIARRAVSTVVAILVACLAAGAYADEATETPNGPPVIYNVRYYGAKGDGQADDTASILKAMEAAARDPACTSAQTIPETPYYGVQPEVLFPAGTYRLTAPLPVTHYMRFRGEGNAALKPDKPDQDIFVAHTNGATWRVQISGLLFLGGARAIVFNTHNLDSGHLLVQRCQFYGQNVCAISSEESWSTLLKIVDCEFLGCEQVLRNTCDMAVLSDCWISTRSTMKNKAVIENRGYLIAERILGVPMTNWENDQRWIDNYGSVTCRNFRFGGEGAGFTPIVNFAAYARKYPVVPNSIVLEDCPIYCLGNPKRKAAIYCVEVPNMITVRNCSGLVDASVLLLDPAINPDAYFADALGWPAHCRYLLQDNTVSEVWSIERLPPVMRRFCSEPKGVVDVRELFARAGNGDNDDSTWLQMAMDYAAAARLPLVIPAGSYKIGKTIKVTAGEVRGEGKPLIFSNDKNIDLFHADAWRITIEGLRFQGGKDQVSIGNGNTDQGMFTVRNCEFASSDGAAVHFRQRSNSTSAHIERCAFNQCRQALINWCDGCMLRDCWITASSDMKDMAVIENRSGYLTCEKVLGVPLVNGCDQRWIDNYGSVMCRDFRFGGEGAGYTAVVNFAKRARFLGGPKVVLDGCWVSALGNNQRACAVYCEEIPNQIAISNCELAGVPAVQVDKRLDLATYFKGVRPGMLRFDVADNTGEFAGQLPDAMIQAAANRSGATDYGTNQPTAAETEQALAAAVAAAAKLPVSEPGVMSYNLAKEEKGHAQQTDPAKYVDLVPPRCPWDVEAFMDGTSAPNSDRLAVAQAGTRMAIVKRIGSDSEDGCWPHVLVKNVLFDLDKTPWLTWRIADAGFKACGYAVKVTDSASGRSVNLTEMHWQPFFDYRAYDLRKTFGFAGGQHAFEVKFYYLGLSFVSATECLTAKKGEYLILDFLRAEAE